MKVIFLVLPLLLGIVFGSPSALAVPQCPISYGGADDAKLNKLYVYFPNVDDSSYPEFGDDGPTTSPAHRFDVSKLTNYTGSAVDLRNAIFDVVADDYCEFNVQVRPTTTAPPSTFMRRNVVAIGTDSTSIGRFGSAQSVDINDGIQVDFARVWAGTYQSSFGGVGRALNGAKSTLERWANSIGGTAAHEGGHNYGLAHGNGLVLAPGEDRLQNHIMADARKYSGEDRAGSRRHFSDLEYSILASNTGLSIQTMWNWAFTNPNAQTGSKLRMDFLSVQPSLIASWFYSGSLNPWTRPKITGPIGATMFRGTTYNRYRIEWSNGQTWSNGPIGQVPGGASFHVGATFSTVNFSAPDAIIITDVQLLNASGKTLALHPRHLGFDAGTLDQANGTLDIRFFNFTAQPLILKKVTVQELPRVLSLNAMVPEGKIEDPFGIPFLPWPESTRTVLEESKVIEKGKELKVTVASLNQKRHMLKVVNENDCNAPSDSLEGPDVKECHPGTNVDLFPATTLFVTATVEDPFARNWDPIKKRYVTGPVSSQLFYQIAGRHLDFNKNGIDDSTEELIDKHYNRLPQ
jgi:hypothetical protein